MQVRQPKYNRIVYEDNNWVIYDGDGIKGSTNGTWLLADENCVLRDDMIFKGADSLFLANVV